MQNNRKGSAMTQPTKTARNITGLQEVLYEQLDAVVSGNGDPERIRAIVQIAGRLTDVAHVEVKVRKMLGAEAGDPARLREWIK